MIIQVTSKQGTLMVDRENPIISAVGDLHEANGNVNAINDSRARLC